MRSKLAVLIALCLTLVIPASAAADAPGATATYDGGVVLAMNGTDCLTLSLLSDGMLRPVGGGRFADSVLIFDWSPTCGEADESQVHLGADQYATHTLRAAYVDVDGTYEFNRWGSHEIAVDIAWVATGPAYGCNSTTWVARCAPAHVAGSVTVDGTLWAVQDGAYLQNSMIIKL